MPIEKIILHMPHNKIIFNTAIPASLAGKRLDQALSALFPEYSRAKLQEWIKAGYVKVENKILISRNKVFAGQKIEIIAEITIQETAEPQQIALNIIYEDNDIIVVNKPVGLIVHPGAGQKANTLLNALLYHAPELAKLPRAGIIHRIDKDTSGLLIIAKNLEAHTKLVAAMQERKIKREYEAVVYGEIAAGSTIDAPIGRHRIKRTAMAVTDAGKPAITHFRILEHFRDFTYIKLNLETGRTHQIRVHMAHIHHPIVGDQTYSKLKIPKNSSEELQNYLHHFKRQALHAKKLTLVHPKNNKILEFEAPLPSDMVELLSILRKS